MNELGSRHRIGSAASGMGLGSQRIGEKDEVGEFLMDEKSGHVRRLGWSHGGNQAYL
jgi:hypothetical protein